MTSDLHKIPFLDLTIFKGDDNCLASTLFRKETAGNTLLHADSAHLVALIRSIPYAQYLRLRHNCTHLDEFKTQANSLHDCLKARSYSKSILRSAFNKALRQSRTSLLFKTKTVKSQQTVKLITRYSQHHQELRKVLLDHWPLLYDVPVLAKYVSPCPEIVFRRSGSQAYF